MHQTPATLLLTRPEPQSRAFLSLCEARLGKRLPALISPVIGIEPVGQVPNLDQYQTIILTSGNGVERLGSLLSGRQVLTVGNKTAEMAAKHGAFVEALGADAEEFLENSTALTSLSLYCRGVHTHGDLGKRLRERGVPIDQVILYDQVAVPLTKAAHRLISGQTPVVVPLFSPRSARLLSANKFSAPTQVIAISQATADAWVGSQPTQIAPKPDASAMCALVSKAFH